MTEDSPPWWATIDDPVAVRMAKKLAVNFTGMTDDQMVLPYPPVVLRAPANDVAVVRETDLVPLWTCYLGAARSALRLRAEMEMEETLGPEEAVAQPPKTPDGSWRVERGLETE